jgi:SMP-30/Gluconolactonase/LRE-like region
MILRKLAPWFVLLLLFAACEDGAGGGTVMVGSGCGGTPPDDDAADDDTGDDDTGDDDTGDDDTGDDDGGDDDTGDDDTGDDDTLDCSNIPQGPFNFTVLYGPKATEDMAMDDQGHVIGADNGNLFQSTYDGKFTMYLPGAGGFIAGLRALPNGEIVYADVSSGTLFRVDKQGVKHAVLSGLQYANGLDVNLDGTVYVAEQDGGRLRRIDPWTGDYDIIADGLNNPNGVTFSPDYQTVYVGSFGGGTIQAIELDKDGLMVSIQPLVTNFGNGMLDGMGVDACGNVYVCEYIAAKVWRISPDGKQQELVVNLSSETDWIPNMQWGSGVGGWTRNHLYVLDISANKMYEVPVGIESKYYAYP